MLSSMDCSAWCFRSMLRKASNGCIVRACSDMAVNGLPLQAVISDLDARHADAKAVVSHGIEHRLACGRNLFR